MFKVIGGVFTGEIRFQQSMDKGKTWKTVQMIKSAGERADPCEKIQVHVIGKDGWEKHFTLYELAPGQPPEQRPLVLLEVERIRKDGQRTAWIVPLRNWEALRQQTL